MNKETLTKIKSFFMDDFHSEDELMKQMPLTDLLLHDQYGKQALIEINKVIENNEFDTLNISKEEVYHNRACILANLESITKCIGHHYGLITVCHTSLNDDFMIFKINKN